MIRTVAEMAANNTAMWADSPEGFEANLVFMICCGDFMRARRRRFPRSKITDMPNSTDDFMFEAPPYSDENPSLFMNPAETSRNRTFYYDYIAYTPAYLMFSNEVEYADD